MNQFHLNGYKNYLSTTFEREDIEPLFELRNILLTQRIDGFNADSFFEYSRDLSGILYEVKCIVDRINVDIRHCNLLMDLNDKASKLAREDDRSQTEIDALLEDSFSHERYVNYLLLDIKQLYIWIKTFMDKIPNYLILFISHKRKGIRTNSYRTFFNSLKPQEGKVIEEMTKQLYGYKSWFENISDIRTDYIIHDYRSSLAGFTVNGDRSHIGITLQTSRGDQEPNITLSNEKIDADLLLFRALIKDVATFLLENIDMIRF